MNGDSTWLVVFLAVIALATLTMAALQVGAAIYAARMARRLERVVNRVEHDVQPIIGRLSAVADEAARVASLASAQATRVDGLMTELTGQVEQSMTQLRAALVAPTREGLALLAGLRAAISAVRGMQVRRAPRPVDDEEALFIG